MANEITQTLTQLTAPGDSEIVKLSSFRTFTVQYTVASIDTNVVVRLEGSLDGVNFTNIDPDGVDLTHTANGAYMYSKSNSTYDQIKLVWVSEAGGTAATIDIVVRMSA